METNNQIEKIKTGIEAFDARKSELQKLADSAKGLTITSVEDNEGYEAVKSKAIEIRKAEIQVEKEGKEMRDLIRPITSMISEKEKELCAITANEKNRLVALRENHEAELKRIEDAEKERQRVIIQKRVDDLKAVNFNIDYVVAMGLTEQQFNDTISQATETFKAEQIRLENERIAKLEAEKLAEQQAAKQKAELEKQKAEQEEQAKKLAEQQAELDRQANELKQRELALEQEKQAAIAAEKRKQEIEAAENALKLAEQEKEKARLAELKAIEQQPDKEKLQLLSVKLCRLELPAVATTECQAIIADVKGKLGSISLFINERVKEL